MVGLRRTRLLTFVAGGSALCFFGSPALYIPGLGGLREACLHYMAIVFSREVLISAGLLIAASSLFAALLRAALDLQALRTLSRRLESCPITPDGGAGYEFMLVEDRQPFAFSHGLLRPKVYVSSGLRDLLTPLELDAVVGHERHHVRRHDPLRIFAARSLAATLFFLPGTLLLRDRYLLDLEFAADETAVRAAGRTGLARALLKSIGGQHPHFASPVAALFNPTQERVARLLASQTGPRSCVSPWRSRLMVAVFLLFTSLAGVALVEGSRRFGGQAFCVFPCLW